MSVDHKVFVACDVNKALDVYSACLRAINDFVSKKRSDVADRFGSYSEVPLVIKEKLSIPYTHSYDFDSYRIIFGDGRKQRQLFMTHVCSCDYADVYVGDKIIFSVGAWGDHDVVMSYVKEALKKFGDVYERDESKAKEFTKVN